MLGNTSVTASHASTEPHNHHRNPMLDISIQVANIYLNVLNQLPLVPLTQQQQQEKSAAVPQLEVRQSMGLQPVAPPQHPIWSDSIVSNGSSHPATPISQNFSDSISGPLEKTQPNASSTAAAAAAAAAVPCPVVQFDPAAPWMAPSCTAFPYKGLENDLEGLLKVQGSQDHWISMVSSNVYFNRVFLNADSLTSCFDNLNCLITPHLSFTRSL